MPVAFFRGLILLLLLMVSAPAVFFAGGAEAQDSTFRVFNLRTGFYYGPATYIGPYNPSVFGDPITYQPVNDDANPEEATTAEMSLTGGDILFGGWTQLRLTPNFYLRGNLEYGGLLYKDENLVHSMWTSFRSFGGGIKWQLAPESLIQPYMYAGINRLSFDSPAPNEHPDLSDFSPDQLGENKQALAFPVSTGFNIRMGNRTSFFTEASFTYTTTDRLDNFQPADGISDYGLSNDAIFSFRFGLSVEILHRSNYNVRREEAEPAPSLSYDPPFYDFVPPEEFLAQSLVPEDSLIASRRREQPGRPEVPDRVAEFEEEIVSPEPYDIEVAEPDPEAQEQFIEDWLTAMREPEEEEPEPPEPEEIEEEVPEAPITDDFYLPSPLPQGALDERGVRIAELPEGYYVQVYASVGLSFAENARATTIEELADKLTNPNQQVFIDIDDDIYKVRIGHFEGYSRTFEVLEVIQGTFVDAFILYYDPGNE